MRPQTPQGQPASKHETLLLIILVCKYDIKEAHFILSNPLFEKEGPWAETSKGGG